MYPQRRTSLKKNLSWLSPSLLSAMKSRNSLFRSFKHTGSVNRFEEYKRQRNPDTTATRHTKTSFLNQPITHALKLSRGSSSHCPSNPQISQHFPVVTHLPLVTTAKQSIQITNSTTISIIHTPHYQLFLSKVTQTLWTAPMRYSALKMKVLN